jgi:hypothetical protein
LEFKPKLKWMQIVKLKLSLGPQIKVAMGVSVSTRQENGIIEQWA